MECEQRQPFTWLPWARSPARITHPSSPSPPYQPPRTPFNLHSASLKGIKFLLNHHHNYHNNKYSRSAHLNRPASLKDVHTILNESSDEPDPSHNPFRKSSIFHRVRAWANRQPKQPPESQNRVVVYYTSLHVIRRTFEDCKSVRTILKMYKVKIDERDLSMDLTYVNEFEKVMGKKSDLINLPAVFVNGKYVGGVDEIRRLHEEGDLKKLIQGLPLADKEICDVCGGFRFVLCEECNGSHRIYDETSENNSKGCSNCNQYGLIKCDGCTSVRF